MSSDKFPSKPSAFNPDWVSAPGDTIRELLETKGISLRLFSNQLGVTQEFCQGLLSGKEILDDSIAEKLEQIFGVPSRFWRNREANYREGLLQGKKSIR